MWRLVEFPLGNYLPLVWNERLVFDEDDQLKKKIVLGFFVFQNWQWGKIGIRSLYSGDDDTGEVGGEEMGGKFDQNILYVYMKFSIKMENQLVKLELDLDLRM